MAHKTDEAQTDEAKTGSAKTGGAHVDSGTTDKTTADKTTAEPKQATDSQTGAHQATRAAGDPAAAFATAQQAWRKVTQVQQELLGALPVVGPVYTQLFEALTKAMPEMTAKMPQMPQMPQMPTAADFGGGPAFAQWTKLVEEAQAKMAQVGDLPGAQMWHKLVTDGVVQLETWTAEATKLETQGTEKVDQAIDEFARLSKATFAWGLQVQGEARKAVADHLHRAAKTGPKL